jgi:hypothetical protein
MERQLWVKRVGDRVKAGETKIDEAILSVMELVQEVQTAQADMSVSAIVSDPALAKLIEGLAALQTARTAIVGSHRRLDKIAGDLSLRTVGLGFDFKYAQSETGAADEERERAIG